ncbi:MAG: dihydropteroate synthase [Candidatus Aminicenantes bacterium]|nr:dihydropteroate synthase [Candidatus Aminicenantes bacterium]
MGILNVTPDSFSDGGFYLAKEKAVDHGLRMVEEGADIIDVGGESTRPGSDPILAEEELKRVLPVISELKKQSKVLVSVDTLKSDVARAALDEGADIINDISALRNDPGMLPLIVEKQIAVILMHMKGTPKTMQVRPHYLDVLSEVSSFLEERMRTATDSGLDEDRIVLDPGIGFGKRLEDNLNLIRHLHRFATLGRPILVGISRKSFIGKILDAPADKRMEGTIASAVMSVVRGAHILRVHDVAAVKKAVLVAEAIMYDSVEGSSSPKKPELKADHVI